MEVNSLLLDIGLGMPALLWLALGLVGASGPGQPVYSHAFCPGVPFLTTWFTPCLLLIETHLSHRAQDSVLYPSSSIFRAFTNFYQFERLLPVFLPGTMAARKQKSWFCFELVSRTCSRLATYCISMDVGWLNKCVLMITR